MSVAIRAEVIADYSCVDKILRQAFDGDDEARLVKLLREQACPNISLVAIETDDNSIAGHIFFSPTCFDCDPEFKVMGLAPMAVRPDLQCSGIGSQLVHGGLEQCQALGYAAVIVLGHKDYYPRFGFRPASTFGICCEYPVEDEHFMALELQSGSLAAVSGLVRYHPAFATL